MKPNKKTKKEVKEVPKVKTMPVKQETIKKTVEKAIALDLPIPNSRKLTEGNDVNEIVSKLKSHKGRFIGISVNRVKSGNTSYCAKVKNITDKMLFFIDMKSKQNLSVMLANIVSVS
jgi:hypothetical protein